MPKPLFKLALLALLAAHPTSRAFAAFGDQLWQWTDRDAISSLAIDDGIVVVGSHTGTHGFRAGKATLLDASTGIPLRHLVAEDGERLDFNFFGWSVAIDSGIAAIGARYDSDSASYSGSAYLFDATTGEQLHKFDPTGSPGERYNDQIGYSISISGNTVIAGAPSKTNSTGGNTGGAYVFDTSGNQLAVISPPGGSIFNWQLHGSSVSIDETMAVMGGFSHAKVIDLSTNQIVRALGTEGSYYGDGFGRTVALDNGVALVGAQQDDTHGKDSGKAYVFDVSTGELISELIPNDAQAGAEFGSTLDIEGDLALVGARGINHNGVSSGAAYLFDIRSGKQLAKLQPDDLQPHDRFGSAVAIDDGVAYVSAPWRRSSGLVYAFDVTPIPEPSSFVLISGVILVACLMGYRSRS